MKQFMCLAEPHQLEVLLMCACVVGLYSSLPLGHSDLQGHEGVKYPHIIQIMVDIHSDQISTQTTGE